MSVPTQSTIPSSSGRSRGRGRGRLSRREEPLPSTHRRIYYIVFLFSLNN